MSILVLGSSGLVGRSLVDRLAAAGHSVVACDVTPSRLPPVAGVSYVRADISRLDQVLALVDQHDVSGIVLLSYMMGQLMSPKFGDILQACQVNITGVTNVLEAARAAAGAPGHLPQHRCAAYGPQAIYGDRPVAEDGRSWPPRACTRQMLALQRVGSATAGAALHGLEVVKIRPPSILGPGSSISPSRFIDRVALGKTGLPPYGEAVRDNVIAVDDIAALLSRLVTGPVPAHSTYLASGHHVTMGELADVVRSVVPGALIEFPASQRQPTYPESFDNSRAVTEFGWAITGLEETVRAHIDGVRAEAGLAAVGPEGGSRRDPRGCATARGPASPQGHRLLQAAVHPWESCAAMTWRSTSSAGLPLTSASRLAASQDPTMSRATSGRSFQSAASGVVISSRMPFGSWK